MGMMTPPATMLPPQPPFCWASLLEEEGCVEEVGSLEDSLEASLEEAGSLDLSSEELTG